MFPLEVHHVSSTLKRLSTRRGVSCYKISFVPASVWIAQGALMNLIIICTGLKYKLKSCLQAVSWMHFCDINQERLWVFIKGTVSHSIPHYMMKKAQRRDEISPPMNKTQPDCWSIQHTVQQVNGFWLKSCHIQLPCKELCSHSCSQETSQSQ